MGPAEADGGLVSKDALIEKVWAGAVVEENNLQAQISALRKALGPDRDLLSTEFGRGYRLRVDSKSDGALESAGGDPAPRRQLPYPLTHLLGRDKAVSDVIRLVRDNRLLTIVGPGGIGKTRLAIETGRKLLSNFADGVCFADMANVANGDLVVSTIAASLGLTASDLRPGGPIPTRLQSKHVLLLIDNSEHLLEPIAEIVERLLLAEHEVAGVEDMLSIGAQN